MTELEQLLRKYGACQAAREKARRFDTVAEAWAAWDDPADMLWALEYLGTLDARRARLIACQFIRHTPLGDGRMVWDLLTDARSRKAVEVAEAFAEGEATSGELYVAYYYAAAVVAGVNVATGVACNAACLTAWECAQNIPSIVGKTVSRYVYPQSVAETSQCDMIRRMWPSPLPGDAAHADH